MTDQDKLRDRIAAIVDAADTEAAKKEGGFALATGDDVAQAIIDDLGLTVEERFVYATDLARDDEPVTDAMAQRVTGKWEKQ